MVINKTYKHFIFDFDGVIADSTEQAIEQFNEIRNNFFPDLPLLKDKKDLVVVYGGYLYNCLDQWIGSKGTNDFFDLHTEKMLGLAEKIQPFKGIIKVLNSLGHKKVSIVTSAYGEGVINFLNKETDFNNDCLFEVHGKELPFNKREKILSILSSLHLSTTDAVYVGDLENDILHCSNVPIDIIAVGYGYHTFDHLKKCSPTYIVNTVDELGILLNNINFNEVPNIET